MGLGFGLIAEIKKAVAEAVAELRAEVAAIRQELAEIRKEQKKQTEYLEYLVAEQKKQTEYLEYLVAEVSRFKNDSDELMISMYAFHHIYGISFTHGDIANKGLIATRYSRQHGFQVRKTQDPRFGEVNLYETEALERCFLGFNDDDYCVETEVD